MPTRAKFKTISKVVSKSYQHHLASPLTEVIAYRSSSECTKSLDINQGSNCLDSNPSSCETYIIKIYCINVDIRIQDYLFYVFKTYTWTFWITTSMFSFPCASW